MNVERKKVEPPGAEAGWRWAALENAGSGCWGGAAGGGGWLEMGGVGKRRVRLLGGRRLRLGFGWGEGRAVNEILIFPAEITPKTLRKSQKVRFCKYFSCAEEKRCDIFKSFEFYNPLIMKETTMNKNMTRAAVIVTSLVLAGRVLGATGFFGNTYIVAGGGDFYQSTGTDDGVNPQLGDGFGNLNVGSTFNIEGFELNTFEDNGSEITHMNLFWSVDNFTNTHQIQINPAPAKSGNDRFWQITSGTQNLLDNNGIGALANGNYTFQAYFEGYTNGVNTPGNIFLNNGGSNYSATFTVIPEPSSIIMMGLAGLAAGGLTVLKRRKRG